MLGGHPKPQEPILGAVCRGLGPVVAIGGRPMLVAACGPRGPAGNVSYQEELAAPPAAAPSPDELPLGFGWTRIWGTPLATPQGAGRKP